MLRFTLVVVWVSIVGVVSSRAASATSWCVRACLGIAYSLARTLTPALSQRERET